MKLAIKIIILIVGLAALAGIIAAAVISDKKTDEAIAVLSNPTENTSVTVAAETVTEQTLPDDSYEKITFAKNEIEETEVTTSLETTVTTEAIRAPLKENQVEYNDKKINVLIEFTGVESLKFYPKVADLTDYRDTDYVLHSDIQITNYTDESFDFIPQKLIIYSQRENLKALTHTDKGLISSDGFYTIGAGETIAFSVDFIGNEKSLDEVEKIKYLPDVHFYTNNVDPSELNNVDVADKFIIDKRTVLKNAVAAARNPSSAAIPDKLTPTDNEYSVNTYNYSYCFSAESINDGTYIKVKMRLQSLTGKAEYFNPRKFILTGKRDIKKTASIWSFDTSLVSDLPEKEYIEGESEALYGCPFELALHKDGSAEYTMYFFTANESVDDFYMFSYDGGNDVFECFIDVK